MWNLITVFDFVFRFLGFRPAVKAFSTGGIKGFKMKENFFKGVALKVVAVPSLVGLSMAQAYAAVPEGVITALADAKTDAVTVASAAFSIFIAILAFSYMRRGAK